MSKDIPIIFSGPMVRALLDGRKTMTRRIFQRDREPPPRWGGTYGFSVFTPDRHVELRGWTEEQGPLSRFMKMKYAKGDRLWVRETVACGACAPSKPSTWSPSFWRREQGTPDNRNGLWYSADGLAPHTPITERGRWVPSIHMPRWASRLTLIVTGTKVERLHEISLRDVWAEGCEVRQFWLFGADAVQRQKIGATVFENLWSEIHGRESWLSNPEVVAISFRVIRANIDAPEARLAA